MNRCKNLWAVLALLAILAQGCATSTHNLPPAQQLLEPGPGVGGPGPGVLGAVSPVIPANAQMPMPGSAMGGVPMVSVAPQPTIQLQFARPEAMHIHWEIGAGQFHQVPLVVPARYNFPQGGIYRLKLTHIAGHEAEELYPTLEIGPTTPRTAAYLAHNAIPIQFTAEDFDQVLTGNFVTKVIYLPDPEFQELALAGVETLVSTRLDPGMDPIVEADRRGSIMAIVRMGNKHVEMPGNREAPGAVAPATFSRMQPAAGPMPSPGVPAYVAGYTTPQYGMPMSGTPIGLPGPPHIPLGGPAGLQKHVIRNHTRVDMPAPTSKLNMHIRQMPGYSYPAPPTRVFIREQNITPGMPFGRPASDTKQRVF